MSKIAIALDELRDAIFRAHHALATEPEGQPLNEYAARQDALRGIDEILEQRPLIQFSATHLGLLELLFAYWRQLETEGDPRTPEPLGPDSIMSIWQGALPPSETGGELDKFWGAS